MGAPLLGLGPDLVGGLPSRPEQPGGLGAQGVEHLGLVERPGCPDLLLERVDRAEQLGLAIAGDDQFLGDALEERAYLGLGVTTERGRERALHDLVGREVWSARNETPPLGINHCYPGICRDFSTRFDIVPTKCAQREQPAQILGARRRPVPGRRSGRGRLGEGRAARVP